MKLDDAAFLFGVAAGGAKLLGRDDEERGLDGLAAVTRDADATIDEAIDRAHFVRTSIKRVGRAAALKRRLEDHGPASPLEIAAEVLLWSSEGKRRP